MSAAVRLSAEIGFLGFTACRRIVPKPTHPETTARLLSEGDFNFGIAARCGSIHYSGYMFKVQSDA
jgi:hypothetical protein